MVPVLVVDRDVKDGVDVADGQLEPAVPDWRDGLVLGVRLQPLVVELEDDEGVLNVFLRLNIKLNKKWEHFLWKTIPLLPPMSAAMRFLAQYTFAVR